MMEKERTYPTFGPKVDRHCPYDEMQLRAYKRGLHICPCCHTLFQAPNTGQRVGED